MASLQACLPRPVTRIADRHWIACSRCDTVRSMLLRDPLVKGGFIFVLNSKKIVLAESNAVEAYKTDSLSSSFSGMAGIISPFTVLPLHLALFSEGESQLDQSSSPKSSDVRGVHEKCFRALPSDLD